jgi:hypothetical protein
MGRLTFCPHEYFTSRQDAVVWLKRITAGPDPQSADGFDTLPTRQQSLTALILPGAASHKGGVLVTSHATYALLSAF